MDDADLMRRAIELAMRGRGRVEPNPMVGCVLVKNGKIIGEGYHEYFGGPHAEPNALSTCPERRGRDGVRDAGAVLSSEQEDATVHTGFDRGQDRASGRRRARIRIHR